MLLVATIPLVAAITGSVFNIWYNWENILPELERLGLGDRFRNVVLVYNCVGYVLGLGIWLHSVFSMQPAYRAALERGEPASERVRARAINLPWHAVAILGVGWLGLIPALELTVGSRSGLSLQIAVSILVATFITVTHAFFLVELVSQKVLFPVLFQDALPSATQGAITLSLSQRGRVWAISAGACPIASLLLIGYARGDGLDWFAFGVGALGVVFGLWTGVVLWQLVALPVQELRRAARRVGQGDLDARVELQRADELGPLIDEFNAMVARLREGSRLRETFGMHVGQAAAEQILSRDPELGGISQEVTTLFCDLRNFTARCARSSAHDMVEILNRFFTEMVTIVEERHGGMVNKFQGDGFIAMFGLGEQDDHAWVAVQAGTEMVERMRELNEAEVFGEHLGMGVGIHTGDAIIGSIGSTKRMEFTAIGDSVNIAARVESLTRTVEQDLLFTDATLAQLPEGQAVRAFPPQPVKGQPRPIQIYTLEALARSSAESRQGS
jgi:adenylate cyclase